MRCNQICKWNSNAGCVKPYGVPCILENVSPKDEKATNADRIRAMRNEEVKTMREILFRGKRLYDGEWIEGHLIQYEDGRARICESHTDIFCYEKDQSIIQTVAHEVDPSTIGQHTGLNDKGGKPIFEGDIIRTHYANTRKKDFVEQVVFHNGRFSSLYELRGPGNGKMWANLPDGVPHLPLDKTPYMEWCEIIGNIYDNPELLDGGADNG